MCVNVCLCVCDHDHYYRQHATTLPHTHTHMSVFFLLRWKPATVAAQGTCIHLSTFFSPKKKPKPDWERNTSRDDSASVF